MIRLLVVAMLVLGLLAFAPGAVAAPEPVACHSGIDGSSHCVVRAAGCEAEASFHPTRGPGVGGASC